jgi:hypothetical protein
MSTLTEQELRTLAYYAIGVASEGKDEAYRLSFAGKHLREKDGTILLQPIGNSGYSVGELQTDLGQHHEDAAALVSAYQDWATRDHPGANTGWVLSAAQQAEQTALLQRDGRHIRDPNYNAHNLVYRRQHGVDIPSRLLPQSGQDIDPDFKLHLDVFLATNAGKGFVDMLDAARVDDLVVSVAKPLQGMKAYQSASPEEQAKIFAVTAKAQNQNPVFAQHTLDDIGLGRITTLAGISARIDGAVSRNPARPDQPTYMETGRDAALAGADVFNALQGMGKHNALRPAWQAVAAKPIADSTQPGVDPALSSIVNQRTAIKALFVQPAQGKGFIEEMQTNGSYSHGDPAHAESRGFYVQGQDFLLWNRHGRGSGLVDGRWIAFSRGEVALRRNDDNTLDVDRARGGQTERLLHVTNPVHSHVISGVHRAGAGVLHYGECGEAVAALQTDLSRLGYSNRDGHALRADGDFGRETLLAVEAFQRDQGLAADGKAGPQTQRAIAAATYASHDQAAALGEPSVPLRAFSDPSHPQHALYAALQKWLPQGTSEARLAQATMACHCARIHKPEEVSGVYSGGDGKIHFTTHSLFASMATVDINQPAPTVRQSMQQVQRFDPPQQLRQGQVQQDGMQAQPAGSHGPALQH